MVTRVPDIVVTLAMSFVWAGCALLVLKTPGGGSATWLKDLVLGSLGNEWIPKAAVVLIVVVALVWIPLRRSRLGLSIYAIGSNQPRGVPERRARRPDQDQSPTSLTRPVRRARRPVAHGEHRDRDAGPGSATRWSSVAAVVLGGVSLAGGRGGVFGPIVAVLILQMIRTDMTFLNINTQPRDRRCRGSS